MYYILYLLHGRVVLLAVTTVGHEYLYQYISIYFRFQAFRSLSAILVLFSCSRLSHHFEARYLSTSTTQTFEAVVTADPDVHTWSEGGFEGGFISK